jgi:hypothetical protein
MHRKPEHGAPEKRGVRQARAVKEAWRAYLRGVTDASNDTQATCVGDSSYMSHFFSIFRVRAVMSTNLLALGRQQRSSRKGQSVRLRPV